jgi:hypothetical protein
MAGGRRTEEQLAAEGSLTLDMPHKPSMLLVNETPYPFSEQDRARCGGAPPKADVAEICRATCGGQSDAAGSFGCLTGHGPEPYGGSRRGRISARREDDSKGPAAWATETPHRLCDES